MENPSSFNSFRAGIWTVRVDKLSGSGGPLLQYRLFFLDGAGHVASAPYEFEATGDGDAAKIAEAWREGRSIELWCGERRIELQPR